MLNAVKEYKIKFNKVKQRRNLLIWKAGIFHKKINLGSNGRKDTNRTQKQDKRNAKLDVNLNALIERNNYMETMYGINHKNDKGDFLFQEFLNLSKISSVVLQYGGEVPVAKSDTSVAGTKRKTKIGVRITIDGQYVFLPMATKEQLENAGHDIVNQVNKYHVYQATGKNPT